MTPPPFEFDIQDEHISCFDDLSGAAVSMSPSGNVASDKIELELALHNYIQNNPLQEVAGSVRVFLIRNYGRLRFDTEENTCGVMKLSEPAQKVLDAIEALLEESK